MIKLSLCLMLVVCGCCLVHGQYQRPHNAGGSGRPVDNRILGGLLGGGGGGLFSNLLGGLGRPQPGVPLPGINGAFPGYTGGLGGYPGYPGPGFGQYPGGYPGGFPGGYPGGYYGGYSGGIYG